MSDFANRLEALSPERRKLIELLLKTEGPNAGGQSATSPVTEASAETRPLSFAQERLWFIDQLQPGDSAYNVQTAVRLIGPLNVGWQATPHLKMLCGGEALQRDLANALVPHGSELWNMYGSTETTIWSSTCRVEAGRDPIGIGSPIANTQFYVLDARLQPVPIGVVGELCIGGVGVARGYLQRPDLTAEHFMPDPFSSSTRARLGLLIEERLLDDIASHPVSE